MCVPLQPDMLSPAVLLCESTGSSRCFSDVITTPPQGGVVSHCLQGADCCGVLLLTPMCLFHTVATTSLTPYCDSWIWHSQYALKAASRTSLFTHEAGEQGRTTLMWGQNVVRPTGLGLIMWRSWQSLTAMQFMTISKTILIIILAFPFTWAAFTFTLLFYFTMHLNGKALN